VGLKTKLAAAAATLTLVGGVGAAGALTAGTASAATPSCGPSCIDLFSKNFGTFHNPQFLMDVYQQKQAVGQKIILFRESNSDPAEDFTVSDQGPVSTFYAAGLVSASLALHYGCNGTIPVQGVQIPCSPAATDDFAFEDEYSPFGVDSGLCVGVAATAVSGEGVTLQPCGVSSKTVWVVDTIDSCPFNPLYSFEAPVINGSDTNFSQPFVATYPATGYPTDSSRPQLTVANVTGFSQDGNPVPGPQTCGTGSVNGPDNNQLWAADAGIQP
jgi:hypothetical protein